jgi:hypothetical protein
MRLALEHPNDAITFSVGLIKIPRDVDAFWGAEKHTFCGLSSFS